jgi:predicted aconitase with swiveling domain
MTWQAEVLCKGTASGEVLRLDAPISFWGGISADTAQVTLGGHPQNGACITDRMLVVPRLIGSSSSSAILLELLHKGLQPRGLILGERDAILAVGVVVAAQMGWPTLPVFLLQDPPFISGQSIELFPDGRINAQEG